MPLALACMDSVRHPWHQHASCIVEPHGRICLFERCAVGERCIPEKPNNVAPLSRPQPADIDHAKAVLAGMSITQHEGVSPEQMYTLPITGNQVRAVRWPVTAAGNKSWCLNAHSKCMPSCLPALPGLWAVNMVKRRRCKHEHRSNFFWCQSVLLSMSIYRNTASSTRRFWRSPRCFSIPRVDAM